MVTSTPVTVLMPAYQEAARIAATVCAARALPSVARVVVIDDGSRDATAQEAAAAGATVIRLPVNGGKGAALRAGLAACPGDKDDIFLLLDADLGATAAEAAHLLVPVQAHEADLAIARLPRPAGKAGFGLVTGLARAGTRLLGGLTLDAPISGQRACRRWVLTAAPIADGYGVEVALNIAAGDSGARVVELPVSMSHAATGRNWAGFRHRGRQFLHIFGALLAAACGRTGEALWQWPDPLRLLAWGLALTGLHLYYLLRVQETAVLNRVPLVLAAALGPGAAVLGALLLRARRKNYRGRVLLGVGGLALLPLLLTLCVTYVGGYLLASRTTGALAVADLLITPHLFQPMLLGVTLLLWLLLGLIDDLYGSADRKGFRGHLRALRAGQLTTGGIKLLGGGLLALVMGWGLWLAAPATTPLTIPLSALLIALSANMLNLFDLRPGRALKVFWLLAVPLVLTITDYAAGLHMLELRLTLAALATFLVLATLIYAPFDFAAMMMLGDTGANPLGAFLGFCLAAMLPVWGQVLAVVALVLFHCYTERVSLTRVIARVPVLAWTDQLGRGPEGPR